MLASAFRLFCDVIVVALIRVRLLIDFYVGTARKLPPTRKNIYRWWLTVEELGPRVVPAATRTWDGEAGDDNWSSPMNWSDNTVPVAEDTVIFNGTSVKTCVLDVAVDIAEVRIEATYAGLLQLDESLTVKSSMSQAGGWISGSGQLTVAANATFTWSGGRMLGTGTTRVDPQGTLLINGDNLKELVSRVLENAGTVEVCR